MGKNYTWYTADQHFWHKNIIRYCNRPFESVEEMNSVILARHNKTVMPGDTVYMLGDICFNDKKAIEMLEQMNGVKHLIIGNHDSRRTPQWTGWESVQNYLEINDKGRQVVLFHYPITSWNGMYRGTVHLHGHSHGVTTPAPGKHICDVGVDAWDFAPVTLDMIELEMWRQGHWNPDDLNVNDERPNNDKTI